MKNTAHVPVLLAEVIEALQPKKGQNFIDGTVGGGGHAEEILKLTAPDGKLLGLDWDAEAIERTKERLKVFGDRAVLVQSSYVEIKEISEIRKYDNVQGILLDLGFSSDQLENSGRGFSFQKDEPLDMRFDAVNNKMTAEIIINYWTEDQLIKIFSEYGEERYTKRIVKAILVARKEERISTTWQLVEVIKNSVPSKRTKIHPATQVFQALRIAVNDELNNIKKVLVDALDIINPGGRIAVISFHSLEDRIVKQFFKKESIDCWCPPNVPECRCGHKARVKIITKKPIMAGLEEINNNPRSRSAKLRVVEKI